MFYSQSSWLDLLYNGHIKVDHQRKSYHFEISGVKVFATCNEINRLSKPLQSRFRSLHLPKYSREQFLQVAVKVCPKLSEDSLHLPKYSREQFLQVAVKVCPKLSEETAVIIAEETWEQQGDIRDVISLSKLVNKQDGPGEIAGIIKTLV
ncbi:MAG TPA: hypothetical protein VEL11_01875 [Candidatus Bathyarchaeia archaeon]|nr:hypothetical protein [Candidatus Bathyarchaeia archaeon]